jgi:hypothetical protein
MSVDDLDNFSVKPLHHIITSWKYTKPHTLTLKMKSAGNYKLAPSSIVPTKQDIGENHDQVYCYV